MLGTVAHEVQLVSAAEETRFFGFVERFVSANGFPFVMLHAEPGGRLSKRVVFEDAALTQRFAQEWAQSVNAA